MCAFFQSSVRCFLQQWAKCVLLSRAGHSDEWEGGWVGEGLPGRAEARCKGPLWRCAAIVGGLAPLLSRWVALGGSPTLSEPLFLICTIGKRTWSPPC